MIEVRLAHILESLAERVRSSHSFHRFVSPPASVIETANGSPSGPRVLRQDLRDHLRTLVRPGRTVFLLGGPGSGKTTLWWAIAESAARFDPPLLPVPINVQTLADARTRLAIIRRALPQELISNQDLRSLDKERRLLLLIDGLNEIESAATVDEHARRVIQEFVAEREHSAVLATSRLPIPARCRHSTALVRPSVEVLLLPFDEEQMWSVVARHPEVNAEEFRAYLQAGRLYPMASNPHLLSILLEVFVARRGMPVPRSVSDVLHLFFEKKWVEDGRHGLPRDAFRRALASLAWHTRLHSLPTMTAEEQAPVQSPFDSLLLRDPLARQTVLERADKLYFLERHDDDVVFVHERVTDHFAAHFLDQIGKLPEFLWYGREWEQTVAQLAGLRDEVGLREILDGCRRRGRIALWCQVVSANLARVSADDLQQVFAAIATNLYGPRPSRDEAVRGLLIFVPSDAIDGLRGVIANVPPKERPAVQRAIQLMRKLRLTPETFQNARRNDARRARTSGQPGGRPSRAVLERAAHDRRTLANRRVPGKARGAAAKRLGLACDRDAVPVLVTTLRAESESDPVTRGSAATALGSIADRDAVPALLTSLQQDDASNVRGSAATALGSIADRQALPALLSSLQQDTASNVRGSAATALGSIADRQAVPTLLDRLHQEREPDHAVRGSSATALGTIGDRDAVPALLASLRDDPAVDVRGSAATALGSIADARAISGLQAALREENEPDAAVRGAAATALGHIGDRRAVSALLRSISARSELDPAVRGAAATALGTIADRRALPSLLKCLSVSEEPDAAVRGATATALGAIGDRQAVPGLLACLRPQREPDPAVRGAAATALGSIGDIAAVPELLALVQKGRESDVANRGAAAHALGLLGDRRSVPALLDLLGDANAWVRSAAAKALTRIGGKVARQAVIQLLHDPDPKVRGVALSGCVAMPAADLFEPLCDRFEHDEDGINRTNAIKGLSLLRDPRAVAHCLRGLWDTDSGVRGESARALVRLVPELPPPETAQIARRLAQYWLECRDGDTANAIYYALKELPAALAQSTLEALSGSERERSLPEWKRRRWQELREEIALARQCESEADTLRRSEALPTGSS